MCDGEDDAFHAVGGDQGGLVAEQGVHDGGGKAGRLGHLADGDGARAALLDEVFHDVDDVLAPRLGFAQLSFLNIGQLLVHDSFLATQ